MKPVPSNRPDTVQQLQMLVVLVPILGVAPALWHWWLSPAKGPLRSTSRLAIILGLSWFSLTALLGAGANVHLSQVATLRFWLTSSFVGSGYFLVNLWLMFRVLKQKPVKLPGLSNVSERIP